MKQKKTTPRYTVEELIRNNKASNNFVSCLRKWTSQTLRKDEDLPNYLTTTVDEVCKIAETMGEEADDYHIIALTRFLNIGCQIWKLDRSKIVIHTFPSEEFSPSIFLLYRPGHYDLLYKQNKQEK